jgi:hypothetical protein
MLFAAWVLSPFIGLAWLDRKAHRPSALVHGTMLLVVLASWSAYGAVAFGPPRKTPAAVFLLCPLVSWFAIGGSTAAVLLASRRNAVTNAA